MPRRPQIGALSYGGGKPERMVHLPRCNLIIPNQPRQNRQPRRIGAGPAIGPQSVAVQIKNSPRAGVPAPIRLRVSRPHFIKIAICRINNQHVPVSGAAWPAFNGGVGGDGIRARVAFPRIIKRDANGWRAAHHHRIGDSNWITQIKRAKICV